MPPVSFPLDTLTQQIAEHESHLLRLRQEFEARQARLAELNDHRAELQDRLRQLETEIEAVTQGKPLTPPPPPSAEVQDRPTLTDALVNLLTEAGRPMTVKELTDELLGRNYPTASRNLSALVKHRSLELVKRGVFRRAAGGGGYFLASPARRAEAPPKPAAPSKASAGKKMPPPARAAAAAANGQQKRVSLRAILTELLGKSREPVTARDLAAQVLAGGYKTKSNSFTDVVWTALGQMKNAESIPGKGWRLKKA